MFISKGYTPSSLKDAEALVLVGGADINPKLYGEKPLKTTWFSDRTDEYDVSLYNQFLDKPKIGICRGGQLMNVLSGGSMRQHIDGHERNHVAVTTTHGKLPFSSIHHQAMIVDDEESQVLAVSEDFIPEAVYYPKTQSLCFQPHPELGPSECSEYFFSLIHEHLGI